jgi:iduronate 2-sulfatase
MKVSASLALTLPLLCTPPVLAQSRPNVLFIAVDDLRPELGCYGNRIVRTPNIDRLARSGMVFERAYCQQAVCSPSRSSLLTGRRPDATKVWDLETHFRTALPDAVTLPQHFKNHGYHAAGLGKIYHGGYDDAPSWSVPHWLPKKRELPVAQSVAFEVSDRSDDELPDGATATEAIERLKGYKKSGQPFFLAVGLFKPHLPFVAPKKYWDLYDPAKLPEPDTDALPTGAPVFAGHKNWELHAYGNIPAANPIPPALALQLRHGYYAATSYMDAQVGRIIDTLKAEGLEKNTIVVLWGDHGWHLGDHGLWNKHSNFERATRAPLIVSAPGMRGAGKKTLALAEFVDLYPTLSELAGLPAPSGLDGISLKPILDNPKASVKKVAISQYPRSSQGWQLMGYSVRDPRWRLTLWRNREKNELVATELYDEQGDPKETKNVADRPENAATIAMLTKELEAAYRNIGAPVAAPKSGPTIDRNALFDRRDTNKDGRLTFDEFMKGQPDPDQAKLRFPVFDVNKDGFLSREEFVSSGRRR